MSHYTSIKTKYTNFKVLKKVINSLGYPYIEYDKNIEVFIIPPRNLSFAIHKNNYENYLSFQLANESYNIITDPQCWTQKELVTQFLKKLELNYGYSETISQALNLGFTRSKISTTNTKVNKFIFQRCVEIR
uniref:hypothetical protein n=1 Tax=Microzonia abyssicola TaxID=217214 RepID=UPI002E7A3E82|nr:hypothetical protein V2497_pgp007 [Syringoderma abyssicola]WAM65082.1 hypothetical protein [Syringoderma abyssicola]